MRYRTLVARLAVLTTTTLLVSATASCSSSDDAPNPCAGVPEGDEACLTARYLPSGSSAEARCPGFAITDEQIAGRREVGFFKASSVSESAMVGYGQGLRTFYEPYGLTFFVRSFHEGAPLAHAISGTNAELAEATAKAGIRAGETPTPEQDAALEKLVNDVLFGPLRDFVRSQSSPVQDRVSIVVLGRVTAPDIARQLEGVIGGLGLSPRLFRDIAAGDGNKNLFELMALPEDFTPTLFLGHDDITRFSANRDGIVSHEMGHALGLQHTSVAGNVMTQGQTKQSCVPGLDGAQVAQLRQGLTEEDVHATRESWEKLFDLRAKLHAQLRGTSPRGQPLGRPASAPERR